MGSLLHTNQALAQLKYVWPRLTKSHQEQIKEALESVTEDFQKDFLKEHPRAKNVVVYRVNKHEVVVRDIDSKTPSVHWIDHPKLVGRTHSFGKYKKHVDKMRCPKA